MKDPHDRYTIDMDRVTRAALGLRRWQLEYDCHGRPFVWTGEAANEAAADSCARHQLATREAAFVAAEATLTACMEA